MKKLIALILVLVMVMSLAACGQKQEAEVEAVPEDTAPVYETQPVQKVIHVLLPTAAEGWEAAAAAQAMAEVEALLSEGMFLVETAEYADAQQQSELLSQIAAESTGDGSQAVVTMPLSEELEPVFAELLEANVAYAMANVIPAGAEAASVTNVQYDQYAIGAAAAAWLVQNGLTQQDKVLIIQGLSEEEAMRTEGFQRYLQGKMAHEGAVIEDPWTSTENIVYSDMQGETADSAETYFTTYMEESDHADTKFIAAWDDAYVIGILEALEGENIDSDNKADFLEGAPFITGCGGSQAMLDVLAGNAQCTNLEALGDIRTMVYSADLLKTAVQAVADYFAGQVVAQDNTQPIVWATPENASEFTGY